MARTMSRKTRDEYLKTMRWTCNITRSLAAELRSQGFVISSVKVGKMLKLQGYSLQSNRKTVEGKQHSDRDAQFRFIAKRGATCRRRGEPAISIDTKKKETPGNLKNAGRTYRRRGEPVKEKTHDFPDKQQWQRLVEIQQLLIELIEELRKDGRDE